MVEIFADAKTDRVLGVHISGPLASDLIAEVVTTVDAGYQRGGDHPRRRRLRRYRLVACGGSSEV
jgi:hypothetical protein